MHAFPDATSLTPGANPSRLQLRCRFYPEVWLDGIQLPLKLKRGLALLVYLHEMGRKVSRQQVAETLWTDAPVETGRARLRRLCHHLNTLVGEDLLGGDADAVWLNDAHGSVGSDVMDMRRRAMHVLRSSTPVSPTWLQALQEPGADLVLDGFSLDADNFTDWLHGRRADQQRLIIRALGRGAEQMLAAGRPDAAAEAATALIRLEPLADTGHALLLAAMARMGNGAAVDAAYHACAQLLRDELGIKPSGQIEAAYAQAQTQLTAAAAPAAYMQTLPPIRFADTADGAVAFLELGSADAPCGTLAMLFGLWSHVEVSWEEPRIRSILMRLATRFRVVLIDRRGVGLSERLAMRHSVQAGVEDLETVRRSLGVDRLWLLGNSVGGAVAIAYAAAHVPHVSGLLLYGAGARSLWAEDYPWGLTAGQMEAWLGQLQASWGGPTSLEQFAPSMADDQPTRDWWARLLRQAASRNSVPAMLRAYASMDVRDRLPFVRAPTLIVQREGDRIVRAGAARYLAERIPNARLALLPGSDHLLWTGDADAAMRQMEAFVDTCQTASQG